MYAIKISKTGRYLAYSDECWYETNKEPLFIFSYEKAKEIAKQMESHYVYNVELISNEGKSEIIDALHKTITPITNTIGKIKKSICKIRIKL